MDWRKRKNQSGSSSSIRFSFCRYTRNASLPAGVSRKLVFGRYSEAGINDFCFIYAPGVDLWKDQAIQNEQLLRTIALEAIPAVRRTI